MESNAAAFSMTAMHADAFEIDIELASSLVAEQFPQWGHLPLKAVVSTGTSNAMFRLGQDLVVRLPLQPGSRANVQKEHAWLPRLAPKLPLQIPAAVAEGRPTDSYPMPWSVCCWLPGLDATQVNFDQDQTAAHLAAFIKALKAIDTTNAPRPSRDAMGRGVPLSYRNNSFHRSLAAGDHLYDPDVVRPIWDDALSAEPWGQSPVWVHGDIASGNLLFVDRRLTAVIDWSAMGIGDPACDLIVLWEMFDAVGRETLCRELNIDDAAWRRSRGWALSTAVDAAYYYEHTNQFMFDQAVRKIEVLVATRR